MQRYSICHSRCPRHAYRIHAARRTNVIARCCQDEVTLRSSMTMRPAFSPPISMSNHACGLSTAPTPPRAKVSFIVFAGFSAIRENACFCGPKQPHQNSRHKHAGNCSRDHCKLTGRSSEAGMYIEGTRGHTAMQMAGRLTPSAPPRWQKGTHARRPDFSEV